jgi:hypothetical protein
MTDVLAGYDLKICDLRVVAADWSNERRRMFLLRPDVAWPVSVDQNVCPSVFPDEEQDAAASGADTLCKESFIREIGLWKDVGRMARHYQRVTPPIQADTAAIAVVLPADDTRWDAVFSPSHADTAERRTQLFPPHSTENLHRLWDSAVSDTQDWAEPTSAGWVFLGFDVADGFMISGLSNCGYSAADRRDAASAGYKLNEFGLLGNSSEALDFRDWSDGRVPAHAPFFLYGIYLAAHCPRS